MLGIRKGEHCTKRLEMGVEWKTECRKKKKEERAGPVHCNSNPSLKLAEHELGAKQRKQM